jgi:hypothetical protein
MKISKEVYCRAGGSKYGPLISLCTCSYSNQCHHKELALLFIKLLGHVCYQLATILLVLIGEKPYNIFLLRKSDDGLLFNYQHSRHESGKGI